MEGQTEKSTTSAQIIKVLPKYYAQLCPVCNGFGTLKYGSIVCQACGGKGYIILPTGINADLDGEIDGGKNAKRI